MKNSLLLLSGCLLSLGAFAEETGTPFVIEELIAMEISRNGAYVVAQDTYGNTYLFNNATKDVITYEGYYPGNGNCVSENGVMVGQAMDEFAVVMINGDIIKPSSLSEYSLSTINGITSDGSKVCGWLATSGSQTIAAPFYAEMSTDGELGEPIRLPFPDKDFLGSSPQFVTATWISEDGKTIIGQITDSTGFYSYPIVYSLGADNQWTYSTPSEILFNPDNLEIPRFPEAGEDLDKYYEEIDAYWEQLAKIENGSNFVFGIGTLDPQGTIMAACLAIINSDDGLTDDYQGYELCVFNLSEKTFKKIDSQYPNLLPTKILSDGTIICLNMESNSTFLVDSKTYEVTPYQDYLAEEHSTWLEWLRENTGSLEMETADGSMEEMVSTGYLWLSDNKSVAAGGYIGNGIFTYVFGDYEADPDAGVDTLKSDSKIEIYNLNGFKIENKPENLCKGIYIINGKKVMINR